MAQNNASDDEAIAGIIAQTRADLGTGASFEQVVRVLVQRLTQAGVNIPDDKIAQLARQISPGDAASAE